MKCHINKEKKSIIVSICANEEGKRRQKLNRYVLNEISIALFSGN